MKGIQPQPLSTETIFKSGCRSSMPELMMLTTTRALPTNSSVPPMASAVSSCWDGHGYVP